MDKLICLILLTLTACQPIQIDDDLIKVSQSEWAIMGNTNPYPFTAEYGEIACSMNEVYFFPTDTANDESQIGLPLNRLADDSLKRDNIKPTVANTIKANADLSEAVQVGLDVCNKVKSQIADFNS